MSVCIFNVPISFEPVLSLHLDEYQLNNFGFKINDRIYAVDQLYSPFYENNDKIVGEESLHYGELFSKIKDPEMKMNLHYVLYGNRIYIRDQRAKKNYPIANILNMGKNHISEAITMVYEYFNKGKLIDLKFSSDKIPLYPTVSKWMHICIDYDGPLYLKVLDACARDDINRGRIDIFYNQYDTLFFSLFGGLFIYTMDIKPNKQSAVAEWKEDIRLYTQAVARSLNQKKLSTNYDRVGHAVSSYNKLIKDITAITNWDARIIKMTNLFFYNGDRRALKAADFDSIYYDPQLMKMVYKLNVDNTLFMGLEKSLKCKIVETLVNNINNNYTKFIKSKRKQLKVKKLDKKYPINYIKDPKEMILNSYLNNLINNPTYFLSFCSIINATEHL